MNRERLFLILWTIFNAVAILVLAIWLIASIFQKVSNAQGVVGQSHATIQLSAIGTDRVTITINVGNSITLCAGHTSTYCGADTSQTNTIYYVGSPAPTLTRTVTGLTENTAYTFFVGTPQHGFSRREFTTTTTAPATPGGFQVTSRAQTSIVLDWNDVSGATGYQVQHGTSSTFASASTTTTTINTATSTATISSLAASTTYYFRVRTVKSGAYSTWTNGISGITLDPPPPAPTGLTVLSRGSTTITIDWDDVTGATGWEIEYGTSDTFASASTSSLTLNSATPSYRAVNNLNPSTTYHFRVRTVKNTQKSVWTSGVSGTTDAPAPTAPTATPTVTCGSITHNSAVCSWTAVAGAGSYSWAISGGSTGTETTRSISLSSLQPASIYQVEVRGRNFGGVGPVGRTSFTTLADPATLVPTGTTTLSFSSITGRTATVSWTAVTHATSYKVLYQASGGSQLTDTSTGLGRSLGNLSPGTTYNVIVQACNSAGCATSSGTGSFTTQATPISTTPTGSTTITITAVTNQGATVSWTAVSLATSYNVVHGPTGGSQTTTSVNGLTTNLTGLTAATEYTVIVQACNESSCAASSGTRTFTTNAADQPDPVDPPTTDYSEGGIEIIPDLVRIPDSDTEQTTPGWTDQGEAVEGSNEEAFRMAREHMWGPTRMFFFGTGTDFSNSTGLFKAGRARYIRIFCNRETPWTTWLSDRFDCIHISFIPISVNNIEIAGIRIHLRAMGIAYATQWIIRRLLEAI